MVTAVPAVTVTVTEAVLSPFAVRTIVVEQPFALMPVTVNVAV
jgi:hypothetical protein